MPETILQTGFELIEYKPEHAIEIITIGAKEPGLVLNELTKVWAQIMGEKGPCATAMFNGKVIGCGGIWLCWPGMGELWGTTLKTISKYHGAHLQRGVKVWTYEKIDEYKLWRLQTPLRSDFPAGVLYAEWLGFKFEAKLENYHPDGTDALIYKIITKKYLPNKGDG